MISLFVLIKLWYIVQSKCIRIYKYTITCIPVCEMTAHLQPFRKPGSIPRMEWPFTGADKSRLRRLEENTSMEDF